MPAGIFDDISSRSYIFTNRDDLRDATEQWDWDEYTALNTYGHISDWDVSQVTDFSYTFENHRHFNQDISSWDVSSGTNFQGMF